MNIRIKGKARDMQRDDYSAARGRYQAPRAMREEDLT